MSPKSAIQIAAEASAPTIDLDPQRIEFGRVFAPLMLSCVYKDGAWQPMRIEKMDELRLHPAAIVFHYGQAVFEGMKAYKAEDGSVSLFRPFENARRFNHSAVRMAMPPVEESRFVEAIRKLVDQQRDWVPKNPGSLYIRPIMVGTEPCLGVRASNDFLFYVLVLPTGAYFPQTAGLGAVRVFVTSSIGRAAQGGTGNIKAAANYAGTLAITSEAKSKGCSQVLFLDAAEHRRVEEMGGMNVFFVANRKLMTPRLTDTILPGVTRDSILKLAPTLGFEVEECDIPFDALREQIKSGAVTEAFACGTAAVIAAIENLLLESGEELKLSAAPGPVATKLYDRLTGIQYGRYADPFDWIVKV